MKPAHTQFRDQVSALVGWFNNWNECEQTIALYTLLKRISNTQAKFLSLILEHTFRDDPVEIQLLQKQANDKGIYAIFLLFLSGFFHVCLWAANWVFCGVSKFSKVPFCKPHGLACLQNNHLYNKIHLHRNKNYHQTTFVTCKSSAMARPTLLFSILYFWCVSRWLSPESQQTL